MEQAHLEILYSAISQDEENRHADEWFKIFENFK